MYNRKKEERKKGSEIFTSNGSETIERKTENRTFSRKKNKPVTSEYKCFAKLN